MFYGVSFLDVSTREGCASRVVLEQQTIPTNGEGGVFVEELDLVDVCADLIDLVISLPVTTAVERLVETTTADSSPYFFGTWSEPDVKDTVATGPDIDLVELEELGRLEVRVVLCESEAATTGGHPDASVDIILNESHGLDSA